MYIRRVKSLEENSKIGKEIISSLQDAVLQEAKKKKRKQKSALSPFCYLDREEKKKEPEVKTDAGNVEQGIEFFNSTFNSGAESNTGVESGAMGESLVFNESMLNEIYPNKGESKKDFISRFMSDKNMKREYPDNKQRLAVAYSYLNRRNKKKNEKLELNENLFEESDKMRNKWEHKYKGYNIVKTGTKEYPFNIYKDTGIGFGDFVGSAPSLKDAKNNIDDGDYDLNESKENIMKFNLVENINEDIEEKDTFDERFDKEFDKYVSTPLSIDEFNKVFEEMINFE